MQLTVATHDDRVVSVDVSPDESVETLKAILEVEVSSLPVSAKLAAGSGAVVCVSGSALGCVLVS